MPGGIVFSRHSLFKIEILRSHGVDISKGAVEDAVRSPDKTDRGYAGRLIAQKSMDDAHVLRVVYEDVPEGKLVVTMYPARKSRYAKD